MTVEILHYGFLSTDDETPDNYQGDDVIAMNKQADGSLKLTLRTTYTTVHGVRVTKHFDDFIPAGMWEQVKNERYIVR